MAGLRLRETFEDARKVRRIDLLRLRIIRERQYRACDFVLAVRGQLVDSGDSFVEELGHGVRLAQIAPRQPGRRHRAPGALFGGVHAGFVTVHTLVVDGGAVAGPAGMHRRPRDARMVRGSGSGLLGQVLSRGRGDNPVLALFEKSELRILRQAGFITLLNENLITLTKL